MPHFTLLSEPGKIDERLFCDVKSRTDKACIENSDVCRCVHRLKVKLGSIVDLFLIDVDDSLTHPFHLHGHKFYVMEMGIFREPMTYNAIMEKGLPLKGGSAEPPHKDSVLIPNPGFVHLRFRADNPGWWIGHCHFDWHLGLLAILGTAH